MSAEIKFIHKDSNWGCIDKPAGLSCHNDPTEDVISILQQTLQTEIHLPHRLDKETSGLLLYAQTPVAAADLQRSLQAPAARKTYQCLVRGQVTEDTRWIWPLTDKAEGRRAPQGEKAQQKHCLTHVRVLKRNNYFSLLECEIETGRTHQIRKHAAIAKHAIIGDTRYGDPKYQERMVNLYKTDRLFLHSVKLMFQFAAKSWEFTSPLPAEFAQLQPEGLG